MTTTTKEQLDSRSSQLYVCTLRGYWLVVVVVVQGILLIDLDGDAPR